VNELLPFFFDAVNDSMVTDRVDDMVLIHKGNVVLHITLQTKDVPACVVVIAMVMGCDEWWNCFGDMLAIAWAATNS
jgi:hypothetical protein